MKTLRMLALALLAVSVSMGAQAVTSKAKTKPTKPAPAREISPAEKTSALFYTVCADSKGSQAEFDKRMKSLADAKTVARINPDEVKGINAEEAKNAWGTKGFTDATKPILITYNASQNICGLRVSDTDATLVRHAFQADLKKLLDKTKGKITVYPKQVKGDITAYGADIVADGKTQQLGIAVSKSGDAFLTFHM